MAGPESTLEKKIRKAAKDMGIYVRKTVAPSHAGFPDRMFAFGGRVLFLEVKDLGKRPTPLQHHELSELMAHNICATWVDNYTDAVLLLQSLILTPNTLFVRCRLQNRIIE